MQDIKFIDRYEALSLRFDQRDESFKVSIEDILELSRTTGLPLKYSKANEFHLEESVDGFELRYGFTLRFNSFDFGLSVVNKSLGIKSAAPWGLLVQLLSSGSKRIAKVMFSSTEDLQTIMKEAGEIYADLRRELKTIDGGNRGKEGVIDE